MTPRQSTRPGHRSSTIWVRCTILALGTEPLHLASRGIPRALDFIHRWDPESWQRVAAEHDWTCGLTCCSPYGTATCGRAGTVAQNTLRSRCKRPAALLTGGMHGFTMESGASIWRPWRRPTMTIRHDDAYTACKSIAK